MRNNIYKVVIHCAKVASLAVIVFAGIKYTSDPVATMCKNNTIHDMIKLRHVQHLVLVTQLMHNVVQYFVYIPNPLLIVCFECDVTYQSL